MALHLLKLCVGADSIDDLRDWVAERCLVAVAAGLEPHSSHVTRMVPKRMEELLDGGSLYWIIKGQLSARQKLIDIKTFTGGDGITRCELILGPRSSRWRRHPAARSRAGAISTQMLHHETSRPPGPISRTCRTI